MSVGVFEPLLRHLTMELTEVGGGNRSAGSLQTALADWAADRGVISGAAGQVAVAGGVWLAVLAVVAGCLLLCCLSCAGGAKPCVRYRRSPMLWVLAVSTAVAAIAALVAAVLFCSVSHRQLTSLSRDDPLGGSGPRGALADAVTAAEALLTSSVRQANTTLVDLCAEAGPRLRRLLNGFATRLAAGLSADVRLTPLLAALDAFVATVERVVASMTAVAAARGGVSEDLVALKAIADDIRTRTLPALESVCGELNTCGELGAQLAQLRVQQSASRLDADASVTAVTLLDRVFRLNVTELGQRVQQAKSTIATALGSVDGPATELVARLSAVASDGLQRGLNAIANASEVARAAFSRPEAAAAVGGLWTIVMVVLIVVCASTLAIGALLVSLVRLGREKVEQECDQRRRAVVGTTCCAVTILSTLFLAGAVASSLGRTAAADGCAPVTTAEGRRALDARLDQFLSETAWPKLRQLVNNGVGDLGVPLPLRLGPEPPKRILESLLAGCDPNRTLAQALRLNLTQLLDSGRLFDSDLISGQLAAIKTGLKKQLLGGGAASLVPTHEVANVLASLAQFAAVLDPVDYSASISELSQPLFRLDAVSLESLSGRLGQLGGQVLARNATDTRGFRLVMEAERLRSLVSERLPPLSSGLDRLRRQFETLQSHRMLGSLTAGLAARLADFSSGLAGLSAEGIERRFDESFGATRPDAVGMLDDLLGRALTGVGRCEGLPALVGRVGGLCEASADSLRLWGAGLQAAAGTACACWLLALARMLLTPKLRQASRDSDLEMSNSDGMVTEALVDRGSVSLAKQQTEVTLKTGLDDDS